MKIADSLLEIIKESKDLSYLEEILGEYGTLSDRDTKELKYYVKVKLKEVVELANTLKDSTEEESLASVINLWFEWRSEWIRYNAVNNYNMVEYGKASDTSVIKSGYVSYLIGKIESIIPEDKQQKIHDVMVQVQYEAG